MTKPMIIWLEDRRDTVVAFEPMLQRKNFKYEMLPKPAAFVTYLKENFEGLANTDSVRPVFLIDIMLHGVMDLSEIGLANAPTMSGNHTGYVFVDRYLRRPESPWAEIPVCFLTERDIDERLRGDIEYLRNRRQGPVEVFSKYSAEEADKLLQVVGGWLGEED